MDKKSLELQITVAADQAVKVVSSLSANFKQLASNAGSFSGDCQGIESTIAQLEKQTTRTAQSLKLFGTNTTDVRSSQTALKSSILDLIEHGISPESDEVHSLLSEYKNLGKQADELDRQNGGLLGSFEQLKTEVGALGAVAAAVKFDQLAAGAVDFSLTCADSFQTARNDFGVLLGDMEAGAALFDSIIKPFNDFTPFDLETTQQATKVLLAAKVPIADLTSWLTKLGNLSQGNAQKMLSFSNAFNKAAAKGKADMEVLNVYIDQGVPILDELAKGFNTTGEEICKMASEGQISFEALSDALSRLTAEGGLYFGGIELSSRSFAAMKEGLSESVKSLASSFGQMLLPAAIKVVEAITSITNAINNSPIAKGVVAAAVAALAVAINALAVKAIAGLIVKLWGSYAAQMAVNAALSVTNPVILAATVAVAALAAGYVVYASKQQQAADATNQQALALANADQAAQNYLQSLKSMSTVELQHELGKFNSAELAAAQQKLQIAQSNLSNIPQTVMKSALPENQGLYVGMDESVTNPAYETAAKLVAERQAAYDKLLATQKEINDELSARALNAEIDKGNDLLAQRDALYAKTDAAQEEELRKQLEVAKSYRTLQTTNPDGTVTGFNAQKTEAIIAYAQKQLDDFLNRNKKEEKKIEPVAFKTGWVAKVQDEFDTLIAERAKAQAELDANAMQALGFNYAAEEAYIEENAALQLYYDGKIADYREQQAELERNRILSRHEEEMQAIAEEFTYRAELAREQIDAGTATVETYGSYASNSVLSQIADTESMQLLTGANPITMFMDALISAALEIKNINKLLNPVSTIVESLIAYSEPFINDALEPLVEFLTDIGTILGQVLQPVIGIIATALRVLAGIIRIVSEPLKILGRAFEWLYTAVIRPVGNAIITVMNAVISALNMIPFVNIKKLELLPAVGEAAEDAAESASSAADSASDWAAKIKAMYEAQIDEVNELLQYQIQSLQSQYELGLISRSEYIEQKNEYKAAADEQILAIETEMAATLAQIESNTYAALDATQAQTVAESRSEYVQGSSYADQWGAVVPVVGHIAGGIVDIGKGVVDTVVNVAQGIGDWAKNLFGFDVGTSYIPYDMPALVHQGEGIIPKSFNEAIQNGDYALVGTKTGTDGAAPNSGTVIAVTVNVEGSVIKKDDLISEIYTGLASYIQAGAAPLPA